MLHNLYDYMRYFPRSDVVADTWVTQEYSTVTVRVCILCCSKQDVGFLFFHRWQIQSGYLNISNNSAILYNASSRAFWIEQQLILVFTGID